MELTQECLKRLLDYDPKTGVFTWRVRTGRSRPGAEAGTLHPSGYRFIKVGHKSRAAHRLAWLYVYGFFPHEIDHINGSKADNRLANLRVVSHRQNGLHRHRANRSSKLGVLGVYPLEGGYAAIFGGYLGWSKSLAVAHCMRLAAELAYAGLRPTD